eukprot:4840888-Heterocapsa_arctica.AAC.1
MQELVRVYEEVHVGVREVACRELEDRLAVEEAQISLDSVRRCWRWCAHEVEHAGDGVGESREHGALRDERQCVGPTTPQVDDHPELARAI